MIGLSAIYHLHQKTISSFAAFFKNNKRGMIFHENRLIFFEKLGKMIQNLSSAAVMIDAYGFDFKDIDFYSLKYCISSNKCTYF